MTRVGRKVFVDMGILPGQMCTPWYDTIFSLPSFDVVLIEFFFFGLGFPRCS